MRIIANVRIVRRDDLIFPELSYRLVGILFKVFNELGPGYLEKHYQRAVEKEFADEGIPYRSEVVIPLRYRETAIGKYRADIVVDGRVLLELKKDQRMNPRHIRQVLAYLQALNLPLGIIAYFQTDGVFFKRIVNHSFIRTDS